MPGVSPNPAPGHHRQPRPGPQAALSIIGGTVEELPEAYRATDGAWGIRRQLESRTRVATMLSRNKTAPRKAAGCDATVGWEPGQVRKEAAITSTDWAPSISRPLSAASLFVAAGS